LLGVNIDHVATLRQVRGARYPEPVHAALVAEQAGADLITVHLREDRRHIQDRDVELLTRLVQTRLNLEMAVSDAMLEIGERVRPADVCLVPERRQELTTEGGLDVVADVDRIRRSCERLQNLGTCVSLFIDPQAPQVQAAAETGARKIELHTGRYADAHDADSRRVELARLAAAARQATALGLVVNAGHGLHYHNVQAVAAIPELRELNIGHAIVARALLSGLATAVSEMKSLLSQARPAVL
jgi:pyridoxine 5-phosphate synthase